MTPILQVATAGAGILVFLVWAVRARRGSDPLGPRPEGAFGDTTVALLAASGVWLVLRFTLPAALRDLAVERTSVPVVTALVHTALALALLRPALRAAPPVRISSARQAGAGLLAGIAAFGIVGAAGLAVEAACAAAGAPLPEQEVVRSARAAEGLAAVGSVVAAAILAPFAEEVFFRGILLPALLRGSPARTALLAQALVFGVMHANPANSASWPIAGLLALVGWLCGWLYLRTASLGAVALLHASFNALNLAFLRAAG